MDQYIENLVIKIEVVSSYFGYTEEYVLKKTPFWLNRKFNQADRERYDKRLNSSYAVFQGVSLVMDAVFNNGKESNNILVPYDEMIKRLSSEEKGSGRESEFKKEIWWKSKA